MAALVQGSSASVLTGASAATGRAQVGGAAALPPGTVRLAEVDPRRPVRLTIALRPRDPGGLAALARAVSTPGSRLYRRYLGVGEFAARFGAGGREVAAVRAAVAAHGLKVGSLSANRLSLSATGTAAQAEATFATPLARVRLPGGATTIANTAAPTLPAEVAGDVQAVVGLDGVAGAQSQVRSAPATGARLRSSSAGARSGRSGDGGHTVTSAGPALRPGSEAGAQVAAPSKAAAPAANVATGGPQPCASATAAGTAGMPSQVGYTADVLASAYRFGGLYATGDLGQGATVALFEEEPYDASDIAAYQGCYGTSASVTPVNVDGGPAGGQGDVESALDIETVIGLAPRARILVYQGPATSSASLDVLSAMVSQDQANVISTSYGLCEALAGAPLLHAQDTLLQEAAVQGQTFVAASGDSGSAMCYQSQPTNRSLSVITPGSDPYATAVGGTALYAPGAGGGVAAYSPGAAPVEGVWNDGMHGSIASASGGGVSSAFAMPSYQSQAAGSLGVLRGAAGCAAGSPCREIPDVAADADPTSGYVIHYDGSWGVVAGTSASAPLWAAFAALTDAEAPCRGRPVGFLNPALYALAGSRYGADFTDTAAANPFTRFADNDPFSGTGPEPVQPGYDMTTGLGSMIAPALAADLCSFVAPRFTVSVRAPGAQRGRLGRPVSPLQVTGHSDSGAALTYSASGLPAGLSIGAGSGVIRGTPRSAGRYTVTVLASDPYSDVGSAQFTWTIARARHGGGHAARHGATGATASLVHRGRGSAELRLRLGAATVRSLVVAPPAGLRFAASRAALRRGVLVRQNGRPVPFSASLQAGRLVLRLRRPGRRVSVVVRAPALRAGATKAAAARRHRTRRLSITVVVGGRGRSSHRLRLALAER